MQSTHHASAASASGRHCCASPISSIRATGTEAIVSSMAESRIAPYGSWASPITSDLIVASSIGLGDILVDGGDVYWIESRPQEQGRSVVVRCPQNGHPADVTPAMPASGQGA